MYRRIFDELKQEQSRKWSEITPESFRRELEMIQEQERAMESMVRLLSMQKEREEVSLTESVDTTGCGMSGPIGESNSLPKTVLRRDHEKLDEKPLIEAVPHEEESRSSDIEDVDLPNESPALEEAINQFFSKDEGEEKEQYEKEERHSKKKKEELKVEPPKEAGVLYDKLERKLRGGYLQKVKTYIPEMVIRKQELEHGDLVKATKTGGTLENGEPRYHFELYRKGKMGPLKSRWQFNRCVIEEAAGRLYIRKTAENGNIRVNGMPFSLFVNDDDAEEFSLKPGDVVDAACQKDKAETARVIWKYDIPTQAETKQVQRECSHESPENSVKPDKAPTSKKIEPPKKAGLKLKAAEKKFEKQLKGKNVLIVADEHYKAGYKEAVEKLGGRLIMADGHYSKPRIFNAVKKADVVVVVVTGTSHHASGHAKNIAKALNKPWTFSENKGAMSCAKLAASTLLLHEKYKSGKALPMY